MSTTPPAPRRFRTRGFGSIQSKLLVMLLVSSILSSAVVGFFAYRTGTQALRDEAFERLTELREERTRSLESYVTSLRSASVVNSQGISVAAMKAFDAGFSDLESEDVTGAQRSALTKYYTDTFLPGLQENTDGDLQVDSFLPTDRAQRYLQAEYTATSDDFDEKLDLDDAGDGSDWTEANRAYNGFYREIIRGSGADDILLLNVDGDVVYTAYKGVDLGTNVKTGSFRGGGLESVFTRALRSNSRDFTAGSDLELYQPSYNEPAGFIATPIADGPKVIGVLVTQVPIAGINAVMTGGPNDDVQGLGATGETYVGGPDNLMRSNSRVLIEDPKEYERKAVDRGTSKEIAQRAVASDSTVMIQPIKSVAQERAKDGKSGTIVTTDYLGEEVLDSYGPADIEGLNWTVIAKMNTSEAFGPVRDFARNILIATAAVVLLVAAASALMARVFTNPLNRLLTGVRSVAGGQLGVQVDASSRDEFGDLGAAFNDMSASLSSKQQMIDAQQTENARLLGTLMPEPVAQRYREGETEISEEHNNVSVVFTEVEGFDEFAGRLPSREALSLLNTLSRGFDEAAAKVGIEKVRSSGTSYVASSGLVVQRVDHVRRVVDFAVEVVAVVDRFNVQNGASLTMRAGVDTGDVRSGLVSGGDVVYNLWGDAVSLAYRVRSAGGSAGIFVTNEVKEHLDGAYRFVSSGTINQDGADSPVWRVETGGDR